MNSLLDGRIVLHGGDNREVLRAYANNSIDSVVTDPPYALVSIVKRFGGPNAAPATMEKFARHSRGFMGKTWDNGEVAHDVDFWREIYRVLKPGGHLLTFGGTRTNHRQVCAIEDAGFEIRDMIAWLYGTGFPKSHSVSLAIDKAAGVEREAIGPNPNAVGRTKNITGGNLCSAHDGDRSAVDVLTAPATPEAAQWDGWGTALKPALEPICLARKPLEAKTVARNVLLHGTGAINVDACRVGIESTKRKSNAGTNGDGWGMGTTAHINGSDSGRFPANVIHDGSDEVVTAFPDTRARGNITAKWHDGRPATVPNAPTGGFENGWSGDSGSAARFFYSAKANKRDRANSKHPTVKPVALMRYLCRLVTPPGGTVLDPFAGSGTTGEAALLEGFKCVLIEREPEYLADIFNRFVTLEAANDNEPQQLDIEDAIAQAA